VEKITNYELRTEGLFHEVEKIENRFLRSSAPFIGICNADVVIVGICNAVASLY